MMKLIFVLVSSYLVTASASRIIGGSDARIEQFPYQVALETANHHFCGGSILSQTKILTAAHCFDEVRGYEIQVRAGSSWRERGGQLIKVARQYIHPNYGNYYNDIAVGILAQPLRFDQYVQPIQLSAETGPYAYASGWGFNAWGVSPDRLQMVTVSKQSHHTCQSVFSQYYDQNTMLCYGDINGRRNVCSGDSGGPLTINGKQVGVASFVPPGGCTEPHIATYVKVSAFINFINSYN